ncbi:MAG: phospholipase D family protein [Rhodocyclaceae bacterium]|nr:phospholipase D family protein [Rhodocyclaceae bacterium]MBK6907616.1 phospholipase D family protein [Rhodocyclaceae bacterium]
MPLRRIGLSRLIGPGLVVVAVLSVSGAALAQELRALFSPWDDIEGVLVEALAKARTEVRVQAYLLTSRPLTRALLEAHRRGVDVQVLADAEMARRAGGESLQQLAQAGVPVWIETRYAAAHNKVMLIDSGRDRPVLVTGSYNFTWSAQARNAENVLVITGNADLARRYAENWRRHREEATDYGKWAQTDQDKKHAR